MRIITPIGPDYCELAEVVSASEEPSVEVRCPECEEWLDDCSCYYAELRERGAA